MKENIFADLYNKVMSFFVSTEETEQTKNAAKSRLKSVLLQDRAGFSERAIQMLKDDMLACIAKYMDIEEDYFDLQISPSDDSTVLELSIPVLRAKTDEEIDKAIKEDEERQKEKAKEIVEQLKDIVEEKVQELTSESEETKDEEKEETEETSEKVSEEEKEETEKEDEDEEEPIKEVSEEEKEEVKEETSKKKEK